VKIDLMRADFPAVAAGEAVPPGGEADASKIDLLGAKMPV
jgi:hypothetical protein